MRTVVAFAALLFLGVFAVAGPAADDKEKLPPPTTEQMKQSQDKLKLIGIAMMNYHNAFNSIPNNTYDKNGDGLLSWRVHILPYLAEGIRDLKIKGGEAAAKEIEMLYKQFKLDEAWNSDVNKKLVSKMPKVFAPVRAKAKAGETYYCGSVTHDAERLWTTFRAYKAPNNILVPLSVISSMNGTSNTGSVFEAGQPIIWTKPDDMPFDPKKPLPKLGGMFEGVAHVLMCDGSVKTLKKDADETELKKMICWNNKEPIVFSKLLQK